MRGKLLGKGGFAKVYQVTSLDTNKIYAAKIVPKANLVKNRARQKVRICCCVLAAFSYLPSHHSPLSYSISTASDRDQNSQDNETCECL
jgi:serine/threonine protein kinase